MATIKITKGMSFPELINYIKETNYRPNEYISMDKEVKVVVGSFNGIKIDSKTRIYPDNTFLVEVDEEVTKETIIDNLVEFYTDTVDDLCFAHHMESTIRQRLANSTFKPEAFYSLNDDMTMTLIWKDGKLVD
ncbi:hypothetical protein [Staphylococcus hominis]|uniref:hypothetical protein n=1 Tax=Staphylococcus hominis TaxID=1290 RepID=UPI002DBB7948|nr:hypothetical protein [Staphylococcus hominis]MEB5793340.1 hypothetical protein [Staphylococcus hominis]